MRDFLNFNFSERRLLLGFVDLTMLAAAFLLALFSGHQSHLQAPLLESHFLEGGLIFALIAWFYLLVFNFYDLNLADKEHTRWDYLLFMALFLAVLSFLGLGYFIRELIVPRAVALWLLPVGYFLVIGWRISYRTALRRPEQAVRTLIVGTSRTATQVASEMAWHGAWNTELVGFISDSQRPIRPSQKLRVGTWPQGRSGLQALVLSSRGGDRSTLRAALMESHTVVQEAQDVATAKRLLDSGVFHIVVVEVPMPDWEKFLVYSRRQNPWRIQLLTAASPASPLHRRAARHSVPVAEETRTTIVWGGLSKEILKMAIDKALKERKEYEILGNVADLAQVTERYRISQVVVASEGDLRTQAVGQLMECRRKKKSILFVPRFHELYYERIPANHLEENWFLKELEGVDKRMFWRIKRLADLAFSALGLTVAGPLFFLPISAAIKIFSPGPVFFSQIRVGRNGQPYRLYKFRTMRVDAEKATGAVWAKDGDSRITGVGKFLRKTRLDELPQLWNVLKGEMSFIGPRPERPEFVKQLAEHVPFYEEREVVTPGLTGWAQVNHPYGSTYEDARMKLEYDLFYLKNRSLMLDLKILVKTIGVVLTAAGH
jgi:exopolysaccharide biosynthesis polyprenyl glycosylphosphotransferase